MSHEPTAIHKPVAIAEARAARARRRVRAGGRVPSDFMPLDYGVSPELDHPVEGGGIPWRALVFIGAAALVCLALIGRGIYSFFH